MQLQQRPAVRSASSSARSSCVKPVARRPLAAQLRAATTETELASSNGSVQHAGASEAAVVDFAELADIIRMVHDTDIIELELKSKKFTLNLRKKEALQADAPVVQYLPAPSYAPAPAPAAAAPAPAAPAAPTPAPTPAPAPKPPSPTKIDGIEIVSPMAGTFYKAGAPGDAPFVKPGDKVKKGQVVGIIEAMKLMNEIEAEISGEVVKVLVDNGTPVSPGTPLILIRP